MKNIMGIFFAVTKTSLYEVVHMGVDGLPYARKIGLRGESSLPIGEILTGDMLAIAKWLQFYVPEGHSNLSYMTSVEKSIEKVNTQWWLGGTSPIVALFHKLEEARECFAANDLKPCDPRWLENTKEIIASIGENHPTITICRWPDMALLES